jgi:hypothetical protein
MAPIALVPDSADDACPSCRRLAAYGGGHPGNVRCLACFRSARQGGPSPPAAAEQAASHPFLRPAYGERELAHRRRMLAHLLVAGGEPAR